MFKSILFFLSLTIILSANGRVNPFVSASDPQNEVIILENPQQSHQQTEKRITIIEIDKNGNKIWVRKNANKKTLATISKEKIVKTKNNKESSRSVRFVNMTFYPIAQDITNRVSPDRSLKYFKLNAEDRVRLLKPFSFLAIDFHKRNIIITTKNKVRKKKFISKKSILQVDIEGKMDFDKKSYTINSKLYKSIFIQPLRGFFRLNIKLNPKAKISKIRTKSLKNVGHLIIF